MWELFNHYATDCVHNSECVSKYTCQKISFYIHYEVVGAAVAEAQYELSKASMVETALVSEPQTAFEQSLKP